MEYAAPLAFRQRREGTQWGLTPARKELIMKIRFPKHWLIALLVGGAVGVGAFAVRPWVGDYLRYRKLVERSERPGQGPPPSLEEFLQYRRGMAFYRGAQRLAEANAGIEVVRAAMGEPSQTMEGSSPGQATWYYDGPTFRKRRQPTVVFEVDLQGARLDDIRFIYH